MIENKVITVREFEERYGAPPSLLVEVQKYGIILFHYYYEILEEILLFDFKIIEKEGEESRVFFKEIVSTEDKNPLFEIHKLRKEEKEKYINYDPHKKDTAVIATEGFGI